MEEFLIKKINGEEFVLENIEKLIQYKILITFFDIRVNEGDHLLMHNKLLDPRYPEFSRHYFFGLSNEEFGRKIKGMDDIDAVVLISKDKEILLKRFYG